VPSSPASSPACLPPAPLLPTGGGGVEPRTFYRDAGSRPMRRAPPGRGDGAGYWDPRAEDFARADAYKKRRTIKGAVIRPRALARAVRKHGGIASVLRGRAWQRVRASMRLPYLTSSGAVLHQAWKAYFRQGLRPSKKRRRGAADSVSEPATVQKWALRSTPKDTTAKHAAAPKKKQKKKRSQANAKPKAKPKPRPKQVVTKSAKDRRNDDILDRFVRYGGLGVRQKKKKTAARPKAGTNNLFSTTISWDALEMDFFRPPATSAIQALEHLLPPRRVLVEQGALGAPRRCHNSEIERAIIEAQRKIHEGRAQHLVERAVRVVGAAAAETMSPHENREEEEDDDDDGMWHSIKSKLLRGAAFQDNATKQRVRAAAEAFRGSREYWV